MASHCKPNPNPRASAVAVFVLCATCAVRDDRAQKRRHEGRLFRARTRLFGGLAFAMRELFADPGRLARTLAQVIELGAPHVPFTLHLDACNERGICLKRALDAFATRNLADNERRIEPAVALGNNDAF